MSASAARAHATPARESGQLQAEAALSSRRATWWRQHDHHHGQFGARRAHEGTVLKMSENKTSTMKDHFG
eukprot:1730330-Pleurochrysis_carterae.AAC.7